MIQEFLSVLFSPQLILQFKEGFQWFYCLKKYTYTLPRIQRRSIIFLGEGGLSFFSREGPNANFYRNPYMYLLPLVFLWICYGTLSHWSSNGFGMGH